MPAPFWPKSEATNTRQQELVGRSAISTQAAEEAQRDVVVAAANLTVAQSDVEVARPGNWSAISRKGRASLPARSGA